MTVIITCGDETIEIRENVTPRQLQQLYAENSGTDIIVADCKKYAVCGDADPKIRSSCYGVIDEGTIARLAADSGKSADEMMRTGLREIGMYDRGIRTVQSVIGPHRSGVVVEYSPETGYSARRITPGERDYTLITAPNPMSIWGAVDLGEGHEGNVTWEDMQRLADGNLELRAAVETITAFETAEDIPEEAPIAVYGGESVTVFAPSWWN